MTLTVGSSCCPPSLPPSCLTQLMSKLGTSQRSQCGKGENTVLSLSLFFFRGAPFNTFVSQYHATAKMTAGCKIVRMIRLLLHSTSCMEILCTVFVLVQTGPLEGQSINCPKTNIPSLSQEKNRMSCVKPPPSPTNAPPNGVQRQ